MKNYILRMVSCNGASAEKHRIKFQLWKKIFSIEGRKKQRRQKNQPLRDSSFVDLIDVLQNNTFCYSP